MINKYNILHNIIYIYLKSFILKSRNNSTVDDTIYASIIHYNIICTYVYVYTVYCIYSLF